MGNEIVNIFYTDDDTEDQDIFIQAAQQISDSIKITTQNDGEELIKQLHNANPLPKLIFLDLNLPIKNGYEILKEIKSIPRFKDCQTIIFSTSDDDTSISITRKLGASMYVTKPNSFNSIVGIINYVLSINWKAFVPSVENYVYTAKDSSSKINFSYIASSKDNATDFLHSIKNTTYPQHTLLESQVLFSILTSPQLTRWQYFYYLLMMKTVIRFYNDFIQAPFANLDFEFSPATNQDLIMQDLKVLNLPNQDAITCTPFVFLNEKVTLPVALGFMYVLEGSKLGGKVIYKNVHQRLALSENAGAAFISDYGADTINNWIDFKTRLSDYVTLHNIEKEVIQAAVSTFSAIYHFFQSNIKLYEN